MKCSRHDLASWVLAGLASVLPAGGEEARQPHRFRLLVHAEGAPTLNRDPQGHALSVVVRVFQLKDRDGFARLTFDRAASPCPGAELLGAECLASHEFTLLPGTTHVLREPLHPETAFVGVCGAFRSPDPHFWRGLVPIVQPRLPEPPPRKGWLKRTLTRTRKPGPLPPDPELRLRVEDCYVLPVAPLPLALPGQPGTFSPACGGPWQPAPGAAPSHRAPGLLRRAAR